MNHPKKRKMEDKYEDFSREELLLKVHELETNVKHLESLKISNIVTDTSNLDDTSGKRKIDFSKYQKRHVAMKLLYLGWDYDGYVVQDNTVNTIENHLFKALVKGRLIEDRATSNYHRCGRTDQGVSSFSQVISLIVRSRLVDTSNEEDELPYCKILNGLLPNDIRVLAWSPVADDFSARFSCKKRTYKYWFPRGDLDIQAMNEAVQKMIGVHDFRNLCKMDVGNGVTNFEREVFNAEVKLFCKNTFLSDSVYDICQLVIASKGFLWHQIRCIVSILFLVGLGREDVDIVQKLLDVATCPRKPQYALSSPLPLNLYSCEFEELDWRIDHQSHDKVIKSLQSHWTRTVIKTSMLESMLNDCLTNSTTKSTDLTYTLFHDNNSRKYRPLLTRPVAQSLEERVSHYVKKGKLKTDVTPTESTTNF